MNMKKLIIGTTLGAASCAFALHSFAGPHGAGGPCHFRGGHPPMGMTAERVMHRLAKLDLSEQQKIDIEALTRTGSNAAKEKRQQLELLRGKMKKLANSETIDEQALKSLTSQMADLRSDMMIMHLKKREQIESLLTDEQKEKFNKMRHRRMSRKD